MAALGETTAALKRMRQATQSSLAASAVRLGGDFPGGFVERAFAPNPAGLRMLTYCPEGLEHPALVVVLHGCTQTAEGYAVGAGWRALAERSGFALLCPEQTTANNPNRCFNWFEPGQVRRGKGEAAAIAAMIETACQLHEVDRSRVFITGLSAGGAMAGAMLAAYPELFAAGAIVAGLPYGAAGSMQEAFGAMMQPRARTAAVWGKLVRRASNHEGDPWPAVSIWHGTADSTVHPDNADALAAQWRHVHGLDDAAPVIDTQPGGTRREVWLDSAGQAQVTLYTVPGLGHGAPLACDGPDGCGVAGPFLLEAGVSAALQSAREWGLAEPALSGAAGPRHLDANEDHPPHSLTGEIESVIRNALAAAGLIR